MAQFAKGDWIVFAKQKWSTSPGPRARAVSAATGGDLYSYLVDKFWVVAERSSDGLLKLRTRSGKEHHITEDDPRLRPPNLRERLLMRHKFPRPS